MVSIDSKNRLHESVTSQAEVIVPNIQGIKNKPEKKIITNNYNTRPSEKEQGESNCYFWKHFETFEYHKKTLLFFLKPTRIKMPLRNSKDFVNGD